MTEYILTQEELKPLIDYNLDTGVFTWKKKVAIRVSIGDVAGCINTRGYRQIYIKNKSYQAHWLAWFYVYGVWPEEEIDHINHDRGDNRISNLREVNRQENMKNKSAYKSNTSGVTGVYWHKIAKKWFAIIRVKKKSINLGCFCNKDDAIAKRKTAEILHNFHPNHCKAMEKMK